MPHHFAVRIWDLVFLEGYEAVIIATVAQMVMLQSKIKLEPSFNEIFEYVHFLPHTNSSLTQTFRLLRQRSEREWDMEAFMKCYVQVAKEWKKYSKKKKKAA